jgi:hypothetical protein
MRPDPTGADHRAYPDSVAELNRLRAENTHLKSLLAAHGIAWGDPTGPARESAPASAAASTYVPGPTSATSTMLDTPAKIGLFRRLFRGREDVHAVRWESSKGKSGYSPACANEWLPGICRKPATRCADCDQRQLLPVTDQVIFDHLAGKRTVGVYPLLQDDTCWFLAADFDKEDWRQDATAFMQTCAELDVPVALEVSRSGAGAHAWIFFAETIPARLARHLGTP